MRSAPIVTLVACLLPSAAHSVAEPEDGDWTLSHDIDIEYRAQQRVLRPLSLNDLTAERVTYLDQRARFDMRFRLGKYVTFRAMTDLLDGEQGAELLAALRALRRRHLSLVVTMDDPEVHSLALTAPRDFAGFCTRVGAAELLEERVGLIRKLQSEGARVVDRRPEDITAALVDRYLDIKQQGAL